MNNASKNTRKYAALGSALGCVVIVAAGCGSDQKPLITGNGQDQLAAPQPLPADEAAAPKRPARPKPVKPQSFPVSPIVRVESRALRHLHSFRADQQRESTMSAAAHARAVIAAVRDLTDAVLISSGLEFATFDVIDEGRTVTINVQPKDACLLSTADATTVQDRILDGSTTVDNVHLRLTSGGSISSYLKHGCRPKAQQARLGATLLADNGEGIVETKPFRVTRAGWTIDWTSFSDMLRIYVYRDGKIVSLAVDQQGRGSGQEKVFGAGYYTLRVAGTSNWRIKVRDGVRPQPPTVTPEAAPTTSP